MDESKKVFDLCIQNKESLSEFVIDLIKEEAEKIVEGIEILENQIKIKSSYINELEDKVEVSFYIINNTERKVNFEQLPLNLVRNAVVAGSQTFSLKEIGDIPPKSIKYNTVYFNKENIYTKDYSNLVVEYNTALEINAKATVEVDLANLPSTIKKKDLKVINEYLNELPYLSENTIDINTFSLFYDESSNLSIIIIVRNGYETEIVLGALPIKVYDEQDNLVYSGVFASDDFNIKRTGAAIKNIVIKEADLLSKPSNIGCGKVIFK